jgi:hypothetical protein
MSFGRNPHVAKAEAEELKAESAKDAPARELAYREAARQWDRAAEREADGKKRKLYESRAESARALADSPDEAPAEEEQAPSKPTLLN